MVLLPFVDEQRLLESLSSVYSNLTPYEDAVLEKSAVAGERLGQRPLHVSCTKETMSRCAHAISRCPTLPINCRRLYPGMKLVWTSQSQSEKELLAAVM